MLICIKSFIELNLHRARAIAEPILLAVRRPRFQADPSSDVIIALTSFPGRIKHLWAAVDPLLRQDAAIRAVILTLCVAEFPDRRIPRSLARRVRRGLEIHWTPVNLRSYDKLLPVRKLHPTARIITVDDDKRHSSDMAAKLIAASNASPGAVLGHFGREIVRHEGGYRIGDVAGPDVPSDRLLLVGLGGILYPPGALHEDLHDAELFMRLCSTNDDIWFWAMSVRAGSRRVHLRTQKPEPLLLQARTPALRDVNDMQGPVQLKAVMEHFGLGDRFDGGPDRPASST